MANNVTQRDENRKRPVAASAGQSGIPAGFVRVGSPASAEERVSDSDDNGTGNEEHGSTRTVDPLTLGDTNNSGGDDGNGGRGYHADGRPRKRRANGDTRKRDTSRKTTASSDSIASLLFSVHLMGSAILKIPEFAITDEESVKLGAAVYRVTQLYDMPIPEEKVMAWIALGIVAAEVYGTRTVAVVMNAKEKKARPKGPIEVPRVIIPNAVDFTREAAGSVL